MAIPRPRVFTIPPSAPFLPTLIRALVAGELVPGFSASEDPLARASLYLPTRRACRLARDVFLDALGQKAAVLPRIVAIGDIDEDELAFADATTGPLAGEALGLPRAIEGLERRLLLTQLILKWAEGIRPDQGAPLVAATPAAALALADDLGRLIDDMVTRQVDWKRLDDLVPDRFDKYWQLTLEFLKIAREAWPQVLAARGAIEPAERRDRLIEAEAARLTTVKDGPVIAAGSTGSMPATAKLLATIAHLRHGVVVLPGLDRDLDGQAWELIAGKHDVAPAAGHPQFAMQALLRRIGIDRREVTSLADPAAHHREKLVSEALCPAAACECWQTRLPDDSVAAALVDVSVVEAANAEEEALAIAVALREAVAQGKTTALVTPDRALARRVVAALARWNVAVEDSGGKALINTPAGVFARLAAQAALGGLEPVTLLALLKHPLMRLGAADGAHLRTASVIERALLRGPRPKCGTAGLRHALATFRAEQGSLRSGDPRRNIRTDDLDAADALIARLADALSPLETIGKGKIPFSEIAGKHRAVIAALNGGDIIFQGAEGAELSRSFDAMEKFGGDLRTVPDDYVELFSLATADRAIRRLGAPGVGVRIFGLLEARLQSVDRMVLGGLTEGTWPPETRTDPWLSRPMRYDLGLDLPERRIGLTAHDFAQSLGAREVILTRAAKVGGAPTLWSRFVQRLAAVSGELRWKEAIADGENYLAMARALDAPARIASIPRPEPRPPREARPTGLSVTDIEHWLRDPYTIYAKHILRLAPLDAVDQAPGYADRGSVIHGAIGKFTAAFADTLPADLLATLLAFGRQEFARLEDYPEAKAFWWPRFERVARWFIGWEVRRRAVLAGTSAEISGEISIALGERDFRLRGIADRIDRLPDGRHAILDYKTGQARTEKQVRTGLAPQLTLEAAMLRRGGFAGIPAGSSVGALAYVLLKGGEPAGENKPIEFKEGSPDSQAELALRRLTEVAVEFEKETTPYRSLVHPMWSTRYGDYDHLARVKEWSLNGGEDETDPGVGP
jgi:ATP-dependent helicase/nuclease subunit B